MIKFARVRFNDERNKYYIHPISDIKKNQNDDDKNHIRPTDENDFDLMQNYYCKCVCEAGCATNHKHFEYHPCRIFMLGESVKSISNKVEKKRFSIPKLSDDLGEAQTTKDTILEAKNANKNAKKMNKNSKSNVKRNRNTQLLNLIANTFTDSDDTLSEASESSHASSQTLKLQNVSVRLQKLDSSTSSQPSNVKRQKSKKTLDSPNSEEDRLSLDTDYEKPEPVMKKLKTANDNRGVNVNNNPIAIGAEINNQSDPSNDDNGAKKRDHEAGDGNGVDGNDRGVDEIDHEAGDENRRVAGGGNNVDGNDRGADDEMGHGAGDDNGRVAGGGNNVHENDRGADDEMGHGAGDDNGRVAGGGNGAQRTNPAGARAALRPINVPRNTDEEQSEHDDDEDGENEGEIESIKMREFVLNCINYYTANEGHGFDERQKRYTPVNNTEIYLGENISVQSMAWEMLKLEQPNKFLIGVAQILWNPSTLANRALQITDRMKNMPGRSPIKLIEDNLLRLLISLYHDFLKSDRTMTNAMRTAYLLKTTYRLRVKIRNLRTQEIKAQNALNRGNVGNRMPRRRLRYNQII